LGQDGQDERRLAREQRLQEVDAEIVGGTPTVKIVGPPVEMFQVLRQQMLRGHAEQDDGDMCLLAETRSQKRLGKPHPLLNREQFEQRLEASHDLP
jgi:hypothetical protein